MTTHVKVVAVLDIVYGSLAAVGALAVLLVFGIGTAVTGAERDQGVPDYVPGIVASMGVFLALLLGLLALLGILAGAMLLKHRRAGKGLGIAVAILSLFSFPLGTALGIYSLVILLNRDTDVLLVA